MRNQRFRELVVVVMEINSDSSSPKQHYGHGERVMGTARGELLTALHKFKGFDGIGDP